MNLYPLGNFSVNSSQQESEQSNETIQVDFNNLNIDYFFQAIQNIDTMNESDLITVIKNHIDVIVSRTLSDEKSMGHILSNPKFVAAYSKAIRLIPITYERRLFVNKLAYEYSIIDNPDPYILEQFKDASKYINKNITDKLSSTANLSRHIANDFVMCRFSSMHERVNIHRLNFCMCKYNPEILTEQKIIWVYEQLFDRIGELFISTMLEVYSNRELDDLGEDFRDVYGNISLAILVILNNMPYDSIQRIILMYIDSYNDWVKTRMTLPRFNLKALSNDYARIVNVVESLISKGYEIP